MLASYLLAACIHDYFLSCLIVLHLHQAYVGQFCQPAVIDLYGHYVMLAVGYGQGLPEFALVQKVTQEEGRTSAFDDACQVLYGSTYVGTLALWLEVQQFPDDVQNMLSAFLWWDEFLDFV